MENGFQEPITLPLMKNLKIDLLNTFSELFGKRPEITIKSPGRVNIIGEHTDYNQGLALPFAIDKYIWFLASKALHNSIYSFNLREYYNDKSRSSWHRYFQEINRILFSKNYPHSKCNILFGGDLPIGAGVSSSSALCCGYLSAINKLFALNLSVDEIVDITSEAEYGMGLEGGKMDQLAIVNSIKGYSLFLDFKDNSRNFIKIPDHWQFLLLDSKISHQLVNSEYNIRKKTCKEVIEKMPNNITSLREISIDVLNQHSHLLTNVQMNCAKYVITENQRVRLFIAALKDENIQEAGKLMTEGHWGLSNNYMVSCEQIDFLINKLTSLQFIYGSRMTGGGFGGCILLLGLKGQLSKIDFSPIIKEYYEKFNLKPQIININSADGIN